MPLDAQAKADVAAVVTDVLKNAGVVPASSGTGSYSLGLVASTTNVYAAAARDAANQAVAQIGALTGMVQALAKAQGQALTADQITAAAQAGAKAALDERIAGAQVNLNVTPAGGAS